jgi:hypothetical protein
MTCLSPFDQQSVLQTVQKGDAHLGEGSAQQKKTTACPSVLDKCYENQVNQQFFTVNSSGRGPDQPQYIKF